MAITAQYDSEADALYVRLREGEIARTVAIDDELHVDVDALGHALGIEALYPALGMDLGAAAARFSLDPQLPAIIRAVADAKVPGVAPTVTAGTRLGSSVQQTIVIEGTVPASGGGTIAVSGADPVICA